MSTNGPNTWTQPLFGPDAVPHVVINGQAVDLEFEDYSASIADAQGVYVETSGGQDLPHQLLESAAAPLSMGRFELHFELQQYSDEIRRLLHEAMARARGDVLSLWLDRPAYDFWEGNGSRTTFTLSRTTGYGSSGVTWAQRPAACWVGTTSQTMVTGSPSAGECQLSQTTDETQIVLGSAPGSGVFVTLAYYPVLKGSAEIEESKNDFNSGNLSFSFEEKIPVRSYG